MLIKPFFASLLLSIALTIGITSCSSFSASSNANKFYNLGEYTKAASYYAKAYTNEKNKYNKGEASFYLGECYRLTNKPSKAVSAYTRVLRTTYKNPLVELYLGQMLLQTGKVEEARAHFQTYLLSFPSDPLGHAGVKSCELQLNSTKADRIEVSIFKEVNSKYSDYSASFGNGDVETIYLSSMRLAGKSKSLSRITGQAPSKIYTMRKDVKGKWQKPKPLEEFTEIIFDHGASCVSTDGKELYFTQCRFDNTKVLGSEVVVSKRFAGVWAAPILVELSGDSLVSAHPAISPDNLTLYFVSSKPEGMGGKDIWMVTRPNVEGPWGEPVNMGKPINTTGDELFPTVGNDGTLYFSSNGHAGLGGLDIFKVVRNENDSLIVSNMGAPINSIADDFGLTFHPTEKRGMFTSSRDNPKFVDNIYNFNWRDVKLSMKGKVYDEKSKKPITGAYLRLISPDGTDKRIELLPDGTFEMSLSPKTDYSFLIAAPGYFNRRQRFTTPMAIDDKTYVFDLPMSLKVSPIMLDPIYYQSNSYQLDNSAIAQMDRLAQLLIDNPTVKIALSTYTSASGNSTDDIIVTQKRAQTILDYLTKKGVETHRIMAKSHGSTLPLVVTKAMANRYNFLKEGDVLTPAFINTLKKHDKALAQSLNNRAEFKVIE